MLIKSMIIATIVLMLATGAYAAKVNLTYFSKGMSTKFVMFDTSVLPLTVEKPQSVTKLPEGLKQPLYGILKLGPKDKANSFTVICDEPDDADHVFYVDANGNGDMTDDPAVTARKINYNPKDKSLTAYIIMVELIIEIEGNKKPATFGMYRYDAKDVDYADYKMKLNYFADFGYSGTINIGDTEYTSVLMNASSNFDYTEDSVILLLDRNEDGRFDETWEAFKVKEPFNLKGKSYVINGLNWVGDKFTIDKSPKAVVERLGPPSLKNGTKVIPFKATDLNGKTVDFPKDYKGKIVLLDFWATWCGPCRVEIPHLVKTYEMYHAKGFEILGISLDKENFKAELVKFLSENKMTWRQVYDGKFWQAEIAKKYGVNSIPRMLLVDGTTGLILAGADELRGPALEEHVKKWLYKKEPNSKSQ